MPFLETIGAAAARAYGQLVKKPTVVPQAIDFDGTADYLSRSSDLVGNADGKTFTFSCWVWFGDSIPSNGTYTLYSMEDTGLTTTGRFSIYLSVSTGQAKVTVIGYTAGTQSSPCLNISNNAPFYINGNTFYHILISNDATDSVTNFRMYINDIAQSLSYSVYTNATVDFAGGLPRVGYMTAASPNRFKGRLAHVYLDYTFRDLSVASNRRLFVTSDLKPASGQASLNPIVYLPMGDPSQPGLNLGTGGNFTLNGVVARSGRGPNQYNVPYSQSPGLLSRSALTGITSGKQFTFAINLKPFATTGFDEYVFSQCLSDGGAVRFGVTISDPARNLRIIASDSSGIQVLNATISGSNLPMQINRNYCIVVSVDLTSTSKRFAYVNGIDVSSSTSWFTYVNNNIDFSSVTYSTIGDVTSFNNQAIYRGQIGGLWFNNSYIDLSIAENRAKFFTGSGIDIKAADLGANGELPTGTSPLIYMPMYGSNVGKNYGTGGDFTVASGTTATGTRGINEFWGNKANFGNSTGNYIGKLTSLTGASSSSNTSTLVCWFYVNESTTYNRTLLSIGSAVSWRVSYGKIFHSLSTGNYVQFNETLADAGWHCLMFSRNGGTYTVYGDGTAMTIDTVNSFNYSGNSNYASTPVRLGLLSDDTQNLNGYLAELWFSDTFIDFSQESNRLKFRDAFGNPVNLGTDGSVPTGTAPLMYMRFDPLSFATNSGVGGNFTINGTITDGGQL